MGLRSSDEGDGLDGVELWRRAEKAEQRVRELGLALFKIQGISPVGSPAFDIASEALKAISFEAKDSTPKEPTE